MEEAAELANYLPVSFKTPKEQEFIEFLWDAFEINYRHGKYQSVFLADLSQKDIEICAALDIATEFAPQPNFHSIESLHGTLRAIYTDPGSSH
jgi:hypothetical protein